MKIEQDVLAVLDRAKVDGSSLRLTGQLNRTLYVKTNKVLELAGARWDKKSKAHVFEGLAADAVEPVILTGEVTDRKKEFQSFYTPSGLARDVVLRANLAADHLVLEPSAGHGALIQAALDAGSLVEAVEVDPVAADLLRSKYEVQVKVTEADFLTLEPSPRFDRVVMNPPFFGGADAKHVMHALRFLKADGALVSIMSAGPLFRTTGAYAALQGVLARYDHHFEPLPTGSFRSSGTDVNTALLVVRGPA